MKFREAPPTTAEIDQWMKRKAPIMKYWHTTFTNIHSENLPKEPTSRDLQRLQETVEDATMEAAMDQMRAIFGRRFVLLYETVERRDDK